MSTMNDDAERRSSDVGQREVREHQAGKSECRRVVLVQPRHLDGVDVSGTDGHVIHSLECHQLPHESLALARVHPRNAQGQPDGGSKHPVLDDVLGEVVVGASHWGEDARALELSDDVQPAAQRRPESLHALDTTAGLPRPSVVSTVLAKKAITDGSRSEVMS